jgi:hypothetical protein
MWLVEKMGNAERKRNRDGCMSRDMPYTLVLDSPTPPLELMIWGCSQPLQLDFARQECGGVWLVRDDTSVE